MTCGVWMGAGDFEEPGAGSGGDFGDAEGVVLVEAGGREGNGGVDVVA